MGAMTRTISVIITPDQETIWREWMSIHGMVTDQEVLDELIDILENKIQDMGEAQQQRQIEDAY
jgi:hypothetical protein